MLVFGVDVVALFVIGVVCVLLVALFCKTMCVDESCGVMSIVSSALTAITMLFCYVIMARILDGVLGIMW